MSAGRALGRLGGKRRRGVRSAGATEVEPLTHPSHAIFRDLIPSLALPAPISVAPRAAPDCAMLCVLTDAVSAMACESAWNDARVGVEWRRDDRATTVRTDGP